MHTRIAKFVQIAAALAFAANPAFAAPVLDCSFPPDTEPQLACNAANFVPGLPNVLDIGDSVSLFSYAYLPAKLAGIANVCHAYANSGGSGHLRECLETYIADTAPGVTWQVIVFNAGLHDAEKNVAGVAAASPATYGANLQEIVYRIRAYGAVPMFVTTTPIQQDIAGVLFANMTPYAVAAHTTMVTHNVPTIDVYDMLLPYNADNDHIKYDSGPHKGMPSPHFIAPLDDLIAWDKAGTIAGLIKFKEATMEPAQHNRF
jgi:hypothetical protein